MEVHSEEAQQMAADAEAMAADAEELTLSANWEDAKPEKVDAKYQKYESVWYSTVVTMVNKRKNDVKRSGWSDARVWGRPRWGMQMYVRDIIMNQVSKDK